jgi:eukaryotic-like serine/threonine-protein kinase
MWIVDSRFKVLKEEDGEYRKCGEGGMGDVYFVEDLESEFNFEIVLKITKPDKPEYIDRFKKEIKIMNELSKSTKIVKILYSNLGIGNPYYVMEYFKNASVSKFFTSTILKDDFALQQKVFIEMIDGIQEIHSQDKFHRDIKPDNFLVNDEENILVSDFGLAVDLNSESKRLTKTGEYGETPGFCPPEYKNDPKSFKYGDGRGDIYMLGKTFYSILTADKNPTDLDSSKVEKFIYHIIKKACEVKKEDRYQDLAELKSDLKKSFDYKLNINDKLGQAEELCKKIHLNNSEVEELFNIFMVLNNSEKKELLKKLPISFFKVAISDESIDLKPMLETFKEIVEIDDALNNWGTYPTEFMDKFRGSMKVIIEANRNKKTQTKALALLLLVLISAQRGEWACQEVIQSINNEALGEEFVALVLNKNLFGNNCIDGIDESKCKTSSIKKFIRQFKGQ